MSRSLTAAFLAAADAGTVHPALLCQFDFAAAATNVWSGYGDLVYDGVTYSGVGDLMGISPITETEDTQANGMQFTLNGISSANIVSSLTHYRNRQCTAQLALFAQDSFYVLSQAFTQSAAAAKIWWSVAFGNGRWVACAANGGGSNDIMYSTNGVSWTAVSTGISNSWSHIHYASGRWVIIANIGTDGPRARYSDDDGLTWSACSGVDEIAWLGLTEHNGTWVAVANLEGGTQQVMSSSDGASWTRRNTPAALEDGNWSNVHGEGGLFVAVGAGGIIMTSPDGETWTEQTSAGTQDLVDVTFGAGLWVAVGSTSRIDNVMTSPDGETWTLRSLQTAIALTSIAFAYDHFVAVGSSNPATNKIAISSDGIAWSHQNAAQANVWNDIAGGNDLFVAISTSGTNRVETITAGVGYTTGDLIDNPAALFAGRMDQAIIDDDGATSTIQLTAESRLVDLQRPRVRRYTDEDQRSSYTADLGFQYNAGLQDKEFPWGYGGK